MDAVDPRALLLALLLAPGCENPAPSALPPAWRTATVVDARGTRRILARPAATPALAIDVPVPRPMVLVDGSRLVVPPGPVVDGRLTAAGAVWITPDQTLIDPHGRVLAREVQRALAVRDDGAAIAYVVMEPAGYAAFVAGPAGEAPRRVCAGLAAVEAPRFRGRHELVVTGARPGGVLGIHLCDTAGTRPTRAVTNGHLRAGAPPGPGFVPPPADPDALRLEGDTLVYHDGEGTRRVPLPAEEVP